MANENKLTIPFATIVRQNRLSSEKLGPAQLFEGLKNESDYKKDVNQHGIGFAANL